MNNWRKLKEYQLVPFLPFAERFPFFAFLLDCLPFRNYADIFPPESVLSHFTFCLLFLCAFCTEIFKKRIFMKNYPSKTIKMKKFCGEGHQEEINRLIIIYIIISHSNSENYYYTTFHPFFSKLLNRHIVFG